MNKDFELKSNPQYSSVNLRERINHSIKPMRDSVEELDHSLTKILPFIPVTGRGKRYKYFNNKSTRSY